MSRISLIIIVCFFSLMSIAQKFNINAQYSVNTNEFLHGSYIIKCNERILLKGYYQNGKPSGKWVFYNLSGQKIISGYYLGGLKNGNWKYYKNDKIITQIGYEAGILNGDIITYKPNGKEKKVGSFNKGTILESKNDLIDFENNFYFITDKMPLFLGQEITNNNSLTTEDIINETTNFHSYLKSQIDQLSIKTKGIVYVEFTVGLLGEIKQVNMVRGFEDSQNQQILNIFRNLPHFEPGYMNNIPVNVKYVQPIEFK